MAALPVSRALLQFVDDEMLRAPLLFDQLVEGTLEHARKSMPMLPPLLRSAASDMMQALLAQRGRLAEYFMHSLREQVSADLARQAPKAAAKATKAQSLSLVDEEEVALDVELSHCIEAIKSVAEHELRELQTFISALVGDMDMARDHNPFRPETFARALWASSHGLPLSRGHQVAYMRHAAMPLAQLLRKTYAASSSRLEGMGVEPAAYRTVILPSGARRRRSGETTFSPDLHRMRDSMPAPLEVTLRYEGQPVAVPAQPEGIGYAPAAASLGASAAPMWSAGPLPEPAAPPASAAAPGAAAGAPAGGRPHWSEVARAAPQRADRQAIELVSRLFDAMLADDRVPPDVTMLISRLHGPAMRLALRDTTLLDKGEHPLWRFVNRLCFAAEMSPDPADPERLQLLRLAQGTIDQVAAEPDQTTGLYRWAQERMEAFLTKRLTRRLSSLASQVGALQKLEDKLVSGHTIPSTLHGTLDVPQLDTVPAELLDAAAPPAPSQVQGEDWLATLGPGDWVRMFLQGRWLQAQLLWPGERHEIWLFGDGSSDATWAVRRRALLLMHAKGLLKALRQRSIVASAAQRVQEQVGAEALA